jgi:RNA polymerase sigma-70 factor (ECF subfamily)
MGALFKDTRWSLVLGARDRDDRALAGLCRAYWYPLYAFVRRRGHSPEDARDLTQEFFARLLEKEWLAAVDPQRGRFRSFLLAAMSHFLANEWDRARAQKRGGDQVFVPIDVATAEGRLGREPSTDGSDAERAFERRWALTLLERALERLRAEQDDAGRARFERLKELLVGDGGGYGAAAASLGISEGAVKVAVHRLRRQYREAVRREVAQTVLDPESLEDELRALMAALA